MKPRRSAVVRPVGRAPWDIGRASRFLEPRRRHARHEYDAHPPATVRDVPTNELPVLAAEIVAEPARRH